MRPAGTAKLHDVARHADVSTATVSRYLNNPELVAPKTAERIRSSIAELNYIPNLLAGSLASSRSNQIAVLLPHLTSSVVEEMVEELVEELEADGMVVMLGLTGMSPERTNVKLMSAIARRADAIITTGIVPEPARTALIDNNVTVIEAWGLPDEPVDIALGFSHREVGRELANFCAKRGYTRPHIITSRGIRAVRRLEGFLEVWAERGLPTPTQDEAEIPTGFGQGRAAFATMERFDTLPDVVICGSDYLAQGLIVEANAAGMSIPEAFAVIGFGNSPIASEMRPTITSVAIDGRRVAVESLKIIRARANGEEVVNKRIDIGFQIIARESA